MRKVVTRATQIAIDLASLTAAFAVAFLVRFDWNIPEAMIERLTLTAPYVVALEYFFLRVFAVHRFAWRYIGLRDVVRVGLALALASALSLGLRLAIPLLATHYPAAIRGLLPIGVIVINAALAFLAVVGVRVVRRLVTEKSSRQALRNAPELTPTILVGAGQAGLMVAKELASRPDLGIRPIGFVDDDPLKEGIRIHGLAVLGTTAALGAIARKHNAKQVLVTIAQASGATTRRVVEQADQARIPVKVIPGLYEIVGGNINLSRLREVAIEDLLRRDPVVLDAEGIRSVLRGHTVLVTGAGGSIGSEICRQVCRMEPSRLVLVERAENNLYQLHRELLERFTGVPLVPCIADVGDQARMRRTLGAHKPDVIFHAAAHKHVPLMEYNAGDALKNNVLGTQTLANLATELGVRRFVMVSTDKAVNPTSVMGATKRFAEMYVQALAQRSATKFITVRFGNVLDSAGSVVPLFREQIAKGGPLTVTDAAMRRYFMTIPEACQLVLQAGTMGEGGEIFILDMGEPVRIIDLARDLIRLSGLRVDEDIEIVITGKRPGEKLFEELAMTDENAEKTRHPKIFVGKGLRPNWNEVTARLAEARDVVETGDDEEVRRLLSRTVPEYQAEPATTEPHHAQPLEGAGARRAAATAPQF